MPLSSISGEIFEPWKIPENWHKSDLNITHQIKQICKKCILFSCCPESFSQGKHLHSQERMKGSWRRKKDIINPNFRIINLIFQPNFYHKVKAQNHHLIIICGLSYSHLGRVAEIYAPRNLCLLHLSGSVAFQKSVPDFWIICAPWCAESIQMLQLDPPQQLANRSFVSTGQAPVSGHHVCYTQDIWNVELKSKVYKVKIPMALFGLFMSQNLKQ